MEVGKEIKISTESDLELRLEDGGRVVIEVSYDGKLGGAKLQVFTDIAKLVDKVTDLIPGDWDDALLDGLAKRLLAKKTVSEE